MFSKDITLSLVNLLSDPLVRTALGQNLGPKILGQVLGNTVESKSIEDKLSIIPSETTRFERRFLYLFFSLCWRASANVLEIGPFLGGTTRAIALGMRSNSRYRNEMLLYSYDRFEGYYIGPSLAEYLDPLFEAGILAKTLREKLCCATKSVSFWDIFRTIHEKEDYFPTIAASPAVLPDRKENVDKENVLLLDPEVQFDAIFVDGCKSWYSTKFLMLELSKCTSPDSFFIFQDYGHYTCFWIPAFLQLLPDYFELVAYVDNTYTFQLKKSLDPGHIQSSFPDELQMLKKSGVDAIFGELLTQAAERSDTRHLVFGKLQHAAALAEIGEKAEAREIVLRLANEPYSRKYQEKIQKALRTPTFNPDAAT